jgi:uridylate kinase
MKKKKNPQKKDIIDKENPKKLKYRKIILKISGETLGNKTGILNKHVIDYIIKQIHETISLGTKIGIIIGGGNIMRGRDARWLDKVDADFCGMIATIINGIVIHSQLRKQNISTQLRSGLEVEGVVKRCNKFVDRKLYLSGDVVLFVGGTGNPFFTTDTAAALRAVEFGADILIKGTKVEGVYSADPKKIRTATFYRKLNFDEVITKSLAVMDLSAFNICKEAHIPICVYNFTKYPLARIIKGEEIGTLVTNGG